MWANVGICTCPLDYPNFLLHNQQTLQVKKLLLYGTHLLYSINHKHMCWYPSENIEICSSVKHTYPCLSWITVAEVSNHVSQSKSTVWVHLLKLLIKGKYMVRNWNLTETYKDDVSYQGVVKHGDCGDSGVDVVWRYEGTAVTIASSDHSECARCNSWHTIKVQLCGRERTCGC